MEDRDTAQVPAGESTAYCTSCGRRAIDGAFCAGCGAPLHEDSADALATAAAADVAGRGSVADDRTEPYNGSLPTEPHTLPLRPARPRVGSTPPAVPPVSAPVAGGDRRRGPLLAVIGLLVLVAAGAAVFLLTRSDTKSTDASYRHTVATTFGPVLGANQSVSDALGDLSGKNAAEARRTVRQAQGTVSSAQGALGALSTPSGSSQLASQARQALAREASYYTAVLAVLTHPSSAGSSEVQTLSSNVTTALAAGGPTLAGTTQTVSGADNLVTWAHRAARKAPKKKGAKPATPQGGTQTTTTTTDPGPPLNGQSCGGGLFAGPNTTCAFAQNVRDAYNNAPGAAATVRVYSPVTHQTYTMNCSPAGSGTTCSGGNNASVTF